MCRIMSCPRTPNRNLAMCGAAMLRVGAERDGRHTTKSLLLISGPNRRAAGS